MFLLHTHTKFVWNQFCMLFLLLKVQGYFLQYFLYIGDFKFLFSDQFPSYFPQIDNNNNGNQQLIPKLVFSLFLMFLYKFW